MTDIVDPEPSEKVSRPSEDLDQIAADYAKLPPIGVTRQNPQAVGLPLRVFLYDLEQIATMLAVSLPTLKNSYLFYDGRTPGAPPPDKIVTRNIAPTGAKPAWRVAEQELIRWLKYKRFKLYEATWARS